MYRGATGTTSAGHTSAQRSQSACCMLPTSPPCRCEEPAVLQRLWLYVSTAYRQLGSMQWSQLLWASAALQVSQKASVEEALGFQLKSCRNITSSLKLSMSCGITESRPPATATSGAWMFRSKASARKFAPNGGEAVFHMFSYFVRSCTSNWPLVQWFAPPHFEASDALIHYSGLYIYRVVGRFGRW